MPDRRRDLNEAGKRFLDDNSIPPEKRQQVIDQANQIRAPGQKDEGKGLFILIGELVTGFLRAFVPKQESDEGHEGSK